MTDTVTLKPCPPCPICRADASWETAMTANVGGKEVIYGQCIECSCTAEYHDWLSRTDGGAATPMRLAGTASSVGADVQRSIIRAVIDCYNTARPAGMSPVEFVLSKRVVRDAFAAVPNLPARIDEEELLDLIYDAISDSFDEEWNSRMGARHIAGALEHEGWAVVPLAALAASSHPASAKQHPDLAGHIADAVRDACNIVLGKVVSFDDSRAIAATILDRINIANAQINPASAGDETLRNVLWQARDTIVQHHQWHAAQTDPDPEHGFIPADEYADSSLYERTMAAIGAVDKLLETGPRDLEALSATPAQEGEQ